MSTSGVHFQIFTTGAADIFQQTEVAAAGDDVATVGIGIRDDLYIGPDRNTVPGDNVVTSVADGKVVVIDKVYEPEYVKGECLQVSVYMDFFNVHVNYWPIDGEVTYYKYHPGKYLLAFMPKASELNEHSSVAIRSHYGDVFFKQLAGTFARRIVTYAVPGNAEKKGEQCGVIKFGSRIDMYLPLDSEIKVKLGDHVKACETVIADLRK